MPSRTYNILAAGKPILALTEKDSEIAQVVEEDSVGWTVLPNEPDKLLQKIFEIYENRKKLAEMGKNARRSALEKYSLQKALEKYKTALK
jgi:glycosyltransferase involved in cell wall biosynthesis